MVPSLLEFNSFCTRSTLATNNKEFIATSARIMVRSTEKLTLHNILEENKWMKTRTSILQWQQMEMIMYENHLGHQYPRFISQSPCVL